MTLVAPILDPTLVAAFRSGTLTPDQAEAASCRVTAPPPSSSSSNSAPPSAQPAPASGAHTPSGTVPPYAKPSATPRRKKRGAMVGHPGVARPRPERHRPPPGPPLARLPPLRRAPHPHRTHPHPHRRGHPRRPEARGHRAHDPPRLVPVLQEAGRAPGSRRPAQLHPRQPHRRPVGVAALRPGRHHRPDRRRLQRAPED